MEKDKPEKKAGKRKEPKPFFEHTFTEEHVCKKCGQKETITKKIVSTKRTITPAKPAEIAIDTKVETVRTLNDFRDKKK